jgi:class 3 adenylate cyclase
MSDGGRSRRLETLLFTDIVSSSEIATKLGDARWGVLLARHHALVRRELKRFGGHEIDTAGDGFFATFKVPADGVRCACAASEAVRALGIEIRAGLHFGEIEQTKPKVAGIAVVTASRIAALADAGEVLVSSTIEELVAGSGIQFEDRGSRALKGVLGEKYIFAVTAVDGATKSPPLDPALAQVRLATIEKPPLVRSRIGWSIAVAAAVVIVGVFVGIQLVKGTATDLASSTPSPRSTAPVPTSSKVESSSLVEIDPDTNRIVSVTPVVVAPDTPVVVPGGDVWVLSQLGVGGNGSLGVIDPRTDTAQTLDAIHSSAFGFGLGYIWLTQDRSLLRIPPNPPQAGAAALQAIQVVKLPSGSSGVGFYDASVWVSNSLANKVYRVDPVGGRIVATILVGSNPSGYFAFGFGGIWAPNNGDSTITFIDPRTNQADTFPVDARTSTTAEGYGPAGVAVGFGSVWVSLSGVKLARIDPTTHRSTIVSIGASPYYYGSQVAVGFGSVWVAKGGDGAVARVDPKTGEVTNIALGSDLLIPLGLTTDRSHVWVTVAG